MVLSAGGCGGGGGGDIAVLQRSSGNRNLLCGVSVFEAVTVDADVVFTCRLNRSLCLMNCVRR